MRLIVVLMLLKGFAGFDRRYDFLRAIDLANALHHENNMRACTDREPANARWITRYCQKSNINGIITEYPVITQEVVAELAEKLHLKISIWYQKNRTSPLRLEFEIPNSQPALAINLLSNKFNRFNNMDFSDLLLILDINKFLAVRKYDPENNNMPKRQMSFIQAVVTEKHPKLCGFQFLKKCSDLVEQWGADEFHFRDIKRFYDTFGLGLRIFTIKNAGRSRLTKRYDSLWAKKVTIQLQVCNPNKPLKWNQMVDYIYSVADLNYFECEKKHCYYVTSRNDEYQRHLQSCKDESEIIHMQTKYDKPDQAIKKQLVEEKIIPTMNFHNKMFSVFDIESLMMPEGCASGSYRSIHRIASIGVATNFGDRREYFMYRSDMKPESLKFLIKQFLAVLDKAQKDMFNLLPNTIREGYFKYVTFVRSREFAKSSAITRLTARKKLAYLRSIISLKTYSWNGEKFDMPVLIGPMVEELSGDKDIFKRLTVIKRCGQAYMEIRFGKIIMRDFMNHSMPMSLAAFSKSCGVTEISKSTFPYELWFSIRNMVVSERFPIYDDFKSSLGAHKGEENLEDLRFVIEKGIRNGKFVDLFNVEEFFGWPTLFLKDVFSISCGKVLVEDGSRVTQYLHTSPSRYAASKDYFESHCISMLDYLEAYNMLDCKLLIQSIENYAEGFLTEWGMNIHDCISLPTLAQRLAFEMYNPEAYPIYSFGSKFGFLNTEIRSQLYGGMCQVFHRLQKVRPEPYTEGEMVLPKSVYCSPDGNQLKKMEFYDFNSLV